MRPGEMDWSPVLLSLQVASASTLLCFLPGLAAAWALARGRWRLKPALDALIHLPLVLPPLCTGYILLILLGRWVAFTRTAAVLAAAAVSFPLMVRALRLSLEAVDPRLEEAARTLGAGELDVFWSVTLPLCARGAAAGSALAFARSLGEFGATIIFAGSVAGRTRTIPLAMFHYFNMPGGEPQVRLLMLVSLGLSAGAMLGAQFLTGDGDRL